MVTQRETSELTSKPLRERKRQNEVLDAAAHLFHENGYSDTTVQDVADALGILKGSLYYYIETKEDLLFQLLDQVHDDVDQLLDGVLALPNLAPLERLGVYVRRQTEYNLRNLERITVYYHDVDRLSEVRRNHILMRRKPHSQFVLGLIRQAQAEGKSDPTLDANILCNSVFATIIWTYNWYRGQPADPELVADQCATFAIGGVTSGVR
jgi:AcrR family transcriptional regulator